MIYCAGCERTLQQTSGHRQKAYCSQACRQRAYRQRQEKKRLAYFSSAWSERPHDPIVLLDTLYRIGGIRLIEQLNRMLTAQPVYFWYRQEEERRQPSPIAIVTNEEAS